MSLPVWVVETHGPCPNPAMYEVVEKVDFVLAGSYSSGGGVTEDAVRGIVGETIDGAPAALDTLNEIAAALGDDENYAATITTVLAGKQPQDSDLSAIAALTTTPYGRSLLTLADQAALAAEAAGGGTVDPSTFVAALYGQTGSTVTSVSAPLAGHNAGDLMLVLADANPGSYVVPDGWFPVLADSANGTGVSFQIAPDTSTAHTLTSNAAQWSNWVTAAYRGASVAEMVASYASNVASAVAVSGANRIVYLAVGAGGVIGTPAGLTKRSSGEIGSLSIAVFDAEPVDGVLPGFTFTNAAKVYSIALFPEDDQAFTTPEKMKLASLSTSYAKTLNAQTGTSYTLVATDAGKVVTMTNASASTLTVPPNSAAPFSIGTEIEVIQSGAGQVTLTPGSGVTISSTPGLKVSAQHGVIRLRKVGTNTWVASGNLSA